MFNFLKNKNTADEKEIIEMKKKEKFKRLKAYDGTTEEVWKKSRNREQYKRKHDSKIKKGTKKWHRK